MELEIAALALPAHLADGNPTMAGGSADQEDVYRRYRRLIS
jgi:hypothetical protein